MSRYGRPDVGQNVVITQDDCGTLNGITKEVIYRGEVVETIPLADGGRSASWRGRVPVERSGWLTLRALSDEPVYPIDDENLHAETAAVYVLAGDEPIRSREDAEYFIRWIDAITEQAKQHPGWRSEREKEHVLSQFAEARRIMEERAGRN